MSDFDTTNPRAVRSAIRSGAFRGFTNTVACDYVQGNLVVVPSDIAEDFEAYCRLNPQALPLLGRSEPGSPHIPELAADLDIRTDVGAYTLFRNGRAEAVVSDIVELWRDDLVAFVIGCSFSFEALLQRSGVTMRHLDEGSVSAMYVTSLETVPAGPFKGPLVVSMRPMKPADAIRATLISGRFPRMHGAPIHIGFPEMIGIDDLAQSYGGHGMTELKPGELPVFWACGATAQLSALAAALPFCITHHKAHMVVTDLPIPSLTD